MSSIRKTRVLIVDDAVVIRKILTGLLSSDYEIEVVGTAANGLIALAKVPQLNPDVVILDIEMPEMNGLETLKAIRKDYPNLPVIILSSLTEFGASTTLEALSNGANDYIAKPTSANESVIAVQQVRDELIAKIKTLSKFKCGNSSVVMDRNKTDKLASLPSNKGVGVLAIGVSTGGPSALAELFSLLPKDIPVPIVLVQHMPPIFTKYLAQSLSSKTNIQVKEATEGEVLEPGQCWIAPGGYHMFVERVGSQVCVKTNQQAPENSCRPAVDVLFRSVANIYQDKTLALIMTGMGQDGLVGCKQIHQAGGQIIVQDESSSTVWGMPGAIVKAGLADKVLPLSDLAMEIVSRLKKNGKLNIN